MIFSAFERFVALRYLRARRQEGFISVIAGFSFLGIMLGVATLIIVMAVMNGFRQELLGRILGVNGHLTIYGNGGIVQDHDQLAERLRQIPKIAKATPMIQAQAMVTSEGSAIGAAVRAMTAQDLRERPLIANTLTEGALELFEGDSVVIIGRRMAQNLGLKVGGSITLVSPRGNQTVLGTVPRFKAFQIVGLFDVGMYEYDSSFIYMPLNAAQTFFRLGEGVNAVEVFAADPDAVEQVRQDVRVAIGSDNRSVDWQQANSSFFNAIQVERNVMFLILSLIILVAAFNILSGQYMLVKGKGRDIAILRTMGATRAMVLRVFFLSGALIGVAGTLGGLLLGILFADNIEVIREGLQSLTGTELFSAEIYFLSQLPAEIDIVEVVQVVAMALVLSFLAPLLPAWRAARLDPVEALRYE